MKTAAVTTENQIIRVVTGSLSTSTKSTGKISPLQTTILSFSKQWTISKIYKKVGDSVKAGDVIAEIDAKSARLDIENSRLSLSNAENNLNKVTGGSSETEKIKTNNTMIDSQDRLEQLEKEYDNLLIEQKYTLTNAETNITALEEKLALAKNELKYAENNTDTTSTTISTIEQDITKAYKLIESAHDVFYPSLTTLNNTLNLENKNNPQYWAIGENNQILKKQVDDLYEKIKQERIDFESKFLEVKNNSSSLTSVLIWLKEVQSIMEELGSLTTLSMASVRASRIGAEMNTTLIESKVASLTTLSTDLATQYANIDSMITTLKNADNTTLTDLGTANTLAAKKMSVNTAQNDLTKAKQSLIQTRATYEGKVLTSQQNIESQKNTIKLNTALYNETINGTSTDVISARNSVKSAQISLEKAYLTLKDYQIVATFDGIINDIPWIIGDTTIATEWVLIENKNMYEIVLSLDQIDIVKVQKWMNAKIVLDAFPTETYTGVVDRVSAVPTETSGVVSYEAIVLLSIPRSDIYTKMSATVEVIITEKNDILVIPTSAIVTENGRSYVEKSINPASIPRNNTQRISSWSSGSFQRTLYESGMTGSGTQFPRSGSGEWAFSGMRASVRWSGFSGSRNSWSNTTTTMVANVDTIRTEITIGMSNGGKTEVVSGLNLGDIIVVKKTTTKSGTTSNTTSSTSWSSTRRNTSGFGGPPPGF